MRYSSGTGLRSMTGRFARSTTLVRSRRFPSSANPIFQTLAVKTSPFGILSHSTTTRRSGRRLLIVPVVLWFISARLPVRRINRSLRSCSHYVSGCHQRRGMTLIARRHRIPRGCRAGSDFSSETSSARNSPSSAHRRSKKRGKRSLFRVIIHDNHRSHRNQRQ